MSREGSSSPDRFGDIVDRQMEVQRQGESERQAKTGRHGHGRKRSRRKTQARMAR